MQHHCFQILEIKLKSLQIIPITDLFELCQASSFSSLWGHFSRLQCNTKVYTRSRLYLRRVLSIIKRKGWVRRAVTYSQSEMTWRSSFQSPQRMTAAHATPAFQDTTSPQTHCPRLLQFSLPWCRSIHFFLGSILSWL